MMNPFVAFSLAASIICFIDKVTNIILQPALEDYYDALERGLKAKKIAFYLHSIHDKVASTKDLSEEDRTIQELCQKFFDLTKELRAILEALYREDQSAIRALRRLQVELDTGGLTSKLKDVKNETYKYICSADQGKLFSELEDLEHAHRWLDSNHADAIQELKSRLERSLREKIFDGLTRDCELVIRYSTERSLSDLLRFDKMNDRFNSILKPQPRTFQWIFGIQYRPSRSTLDYPDWLESPDPLFWISGKPGSGKSTLMKHLSVHKRTRMALISPTHRRGGVVGYFSFWNFGKSSFQRNEEGLLRSLT